MRDVVWIWSRDRIEDIVVPGTEAGPDAPTLYMAISPQAALLFMEQNGLTSIHAMVRMPGEPQPMEWSLDGLPKPQVDMPTVEAQVARVLRGCSQCGQPWAAWACGPTHAMVRAELGIDYQPDGQAEVPYLMPHG